MKWKESHSETLDHETNLISKKDTCREKEETKKGKKKRMSSMVRLSVILTISAIILKGGLRPKCTISC